jgi:predicted AlkP superfamily phosphohydrolase/phosphomutase
VSKQRTFILGLDAAVPELIDRFIAEGRLPNIAKLIERGARARPFPALPTHTPVNWATIGTGAWPGTHGITGFGMIDKTGPLDTTLTSFDTGNLQAPPLWQIAADVGLKSLVLKWGGPTFPITVTNGLQVDGCFCVLCEHEIAGPVLFSNDTENGGQVVNWSAADWTNVPTSAKPAMAASLTLGVDDETVTLCALLIAAGDNYDTLLLSLTPNANDAFATLAIGDWTEWQTLTFPTRGPGTVRLKWSDLTAEGDAVTPRIYATQIMPLAGWCGPEDVSAELVEKVGPFLQRPGYNQRGAVYGAWAGTETMMEEIEYQHEWYARSMEYLCERDDYDLVFLHTHAPDYIQDAIMPEAEPLTTPDDATFAQSIEYVAQTYASCDRMVGHIVDRIAGPDDLIVIVSDHGCIGYPENRDNHNIMRDLLIDNGYMVYKTDEKSDQAGSKPTRGQDDLDWSKTKAIFFDSIHLFLNVKGRQPEGAIEPEDFEQVRDDLIELLRTYRDPELGRCPFPLILKSEDAAMLGLYGDRVGDLIVCSAPGALYGEGHGTLLPTATFGLSSNSATLILAGPAAREGATVDRPCWLTDVAPTIAHAMGIPPADTFQGAVLHEMLRTQS